MSAIKEEDYDSDYCLEHYSFSAVVTDASGESNTVTGDNSLTVNLAEYERPLDVSVTFTEDPDFLVEIHYEEGETESQVAQITLCPDQN